VKSATNKAIVVPERDIQSAIIQYLKLKKYYVFRMNSGTQVIEQPATARRVIRSAPAGTPDLLALRDGMAPLFVEVKRPGNKPTPIQREMMAILEGYGAHCVVATSVDDLREQGV